MSDHTHHDDRTSHYEADSLTLVGAVEMGTGVMIGAGIFALTGQAAGLTGERPMAVRQRSGPARSRGADRAMVCSLQHQKTA